MSPAELALSVVTYGMITVLSLLFLFAIVGLLALINHFIDDCFDINIANEIKRFFND